MKRNRNTVAFQRHISSFSTYTKANVFYLFDDIYLFSPKRWVTKTLHPFVPVTL